MPRAFNVVILAAGRGERFSAAGVTTPKPLLTFRGQTLLDHTAELAIEMKPERLVFVVTPEVAKFARQDAPYFEEDYMVPVSITQPGPAASALLAGAHLPPDEPVVFMDCDNYYAPDQRGWIEQLPIGDQFLTVAPQPVWLSATSFCCARVCEGSALDMNEKRGFNYEPSLGSWLVGTGIYGFPSFGYFRSRAASVLLGGSERSMSSFLSLGCGAVEVNGWHPVGTPEQMAVAERAVK